MSENRLLISRVELRPDPRNTKSVYYWGGWIGLTLLVLLIAYRIDYERKEYQSLVPWKSIDSKKGHEIEMV